MRGSVCKSLGHFAFSLHMHKLLLTYMHNIHIATYVYIYLYIHYFTEYRINVREIKFFQQRVLQPDHLPTFVIRWRALAPVDLAT